MRMLLSVLALVGASVSSACDAGAAAPNSAAVASTTGKAALEITPTGRVTDAAGLLTIAQRERLTAKLKHLEEATQHQMAVVTVSTLGGMSAKDFARDLANKWGVGRKGVDDGIMLLVAPNERNVRIGVGYGLESTLTPEILQPIIDNSILPHFRKGDFPGGIEAGTDAVASRLLGKPGPLHTSGGFANSAPLAKVVYLKPGEEMPDIGDDQPWLSIEARFNGLFPGSGWSRKPNGESVFYVSLLEDDGSLETALAAATQWARDNGVPTIWVQTTPS